MALSASAATAAKLELTGVNLSGAEFGSDVPGTFGQDYIYPNQAEVDYYMGKGMNVFRLPFKWERLQGTLNGSFSSAEFNRLTTFVNQTTAKGATVILDPHNYARYKPAGGSSTLIGTSTVPDAAFGDLWSRLANQFKSNTNVVFGLMNEPYGVSTTQWRTSANAAIDAIRDTGATNLILVPGVSWTGAHSWTTSGNAAAFTPANIVDPLNNYAIELHQYLDSDSSGTHETVVSPTIGSQRLVNVTNWLKTNNLRGFLGEFAVPNSLIGTGASQIGDEALHDMLGYMEANADQWLGYAWWGGGPWWSSNYMFRLDPTNLGAANPTDAAAMAVLAQYVAVPEPTAMAVLLVASCLSIRRGRCATSR